MPFSDRHPAARDAEILWETFFQNVHPMLKVFFAWEVHKLRSASVTPAVDKAISYQEHALIFAIYLITAVSLSEDECKSLLGRAKIELTAEFQWLCDHALAACNFMSASDIVTLQTLTVYLVSLLLALTFNI